VGSCSGVEAALVELLVALVLLSALGCALIWRAVIRILRAERLALLAISEWQAASQSADDGAAARDGRRKSG
jgi:hypothetical protein